MENLDPTSLREEKNNMSTTNWPKENLGSKKEFENLNERRDKGQIQTKDFLIEKKELKEKIDSLTFYRL